MSKASKQSLYAKDLAGTPLGTAVYHPIEMRPHSARVGDIAFFDETGKYQWRLRELHWNGHGIAESEAVTEEIPGHFKIAVGGSVKARWKEMKLGSTLPIAATPGYKSGSDLSNWKA